MTAQKTFKRHPIKNFLIKKDMQMRYIAKILWAVVFTAIITTVVLAAVYYVKSGSGYFYFMSNDLMEDLKRQSILETILPSLIIAEAVSVLVGILIGLFSSRKIALPVFKIEQWLQKLVDGDYGARLIFREKEEFQTMSRLCNQVSESLVSMFGRVHDDLEATEKSLQDEEAKAKLAALRNSLPNPKH